MRISLIKCIANEICKLIQITVKMMLESARVSNAALGVIAGRGRPEIPNQGIGLTPLFIPRLRDMRGAVRRNNPFNLLGHHVLTLGWGLQGTTLERLEFCLSQFAELYRPFFLAKVRLAPPTKRDAFSSGVHL